MNPVNNDFASTNFCTAVIDNWFRPVNYERFKEECSKDLWRAPMF